MGIVSAIVLFAVIWFMTFLIVLPIRLQTQGDAGTTLEGTHQSAPEDAQIGKRARITTMVAFVIWAIVAGIILSGVITVRDLDWFNQMTPAATGN